LERRGFEPPASAVQVRLRSVTGVSSVSELFGNRERYPASHMFSIATSNVLGRKGLDSILGPNALFYSGEAAMNPTGTWLVSEIVQAVQEFEVGFFPSIEGSGISPPAGVGTGWFVAKGANNPQEAITFIDYLLQDDTARLTIEVLNTIPVPLIPKHSTFPICSSWCWMTFPNILKQRLSATT
jgi:Bacterial extracellular solute-binding protein